MKHSIFTRLLALLLALLLLGSVAVYAAEGDAEAPAEDAEARAEDAEASAEDADAPAEDAEAPAEDVEAPAEDAEAPGNEPTRSGESDAELIAKYHIPNNWARPALLFVARNGLMTGRGDGTLSPTENTTRAEVATMLIRILRTERQASLSGFVDVKTSDWFYPYMAKAVAAGLFNGAGNKLMPNDKITREQAFAVLARMFGVSGTDYSVFDKFSDASSVSSWARPTMAGMIQAGYVNGAGNKLNPKGNITRQELAQVLYNLLTGLGTTMPNYYYTGRFALAADTLPKNTTINGDLLLSNEVVYVELENVTVTGRLTIQGTSNVVVVLKNCKIGTLSLCRNAEVRVNNSAVQSVYEFDGCVLIGNCGTFNSYCDGELEGNAQNLIAAGENFEIMKGYTVGKLSVLSGKGSNDGVISTAEIYVRDFKLTGSGAIGTVILYKPGFTTTNTVGKTENRLDPGIANVKPTWMKPGNATETYHSLIMKANLYGFGSYPFDRYFTAEWRQDGTLVKKTTNIKMTEGVEVYCSMDFLEAINNGQDYSVVKLTLRYEGKKRDFIYNVGLGSYQAEQPTDDTTTPETGSVVRTQNVQATISYAVAMYGSFNGSSFSYPLNKTAPAGATVTFLVSSKNTGAQIRLADGTVGWVQRSAVQVIPGNYYTTEHYSTEVKESFVNGKGYSSKTKYLIWVSLWTQEVCIFQGSKGNWKLLRSDPCCSGANESPTPVESVEVLYRQPILNYDDYYCNHFTVFDSARGFHSWPIKNGTTNTVYDPTMGAPNSQSCVRLMDEAAEWIYKNIPDGTAVEIY